jgi:hypothetical protein
MQNTKIVKAPLEKIVSYTKKAKCRFKRVSGTGANPSIKMGRGHAGEIFYSLLTAPFFGSTYR